MNQLGGFPLLTLIVAIPLLGAVIILLLRPARGDTLRWLALLIASAEFFISLFLYMGWVPDTSGSVQFQDGPWPWIPSLGIQHYLAIDGVNVHMVGLTTLLVPLVLIAAWRRPAPAGRATVFWILVLEASTLGALTTRDLACFTLFWLTALVSAFLLAGMDRYPSRAAAHYVTAMAIAAVLMLACLVFLPGLGAGLDITDPSTNPLPWRAQAWLFWAMAFALGIGSALFPFHRWYIAAQRHASRPASVLISVLLLNIGCCGLIRFCLPAFPLAATRFAPALVLLSTLGLAYGAVKALQQPTFPAMLAYWNVAQVNLALMGIFTLQDLGLHGATLLMFGRALCTAMLLLVDPAQDEPQASPIQGSNLDMTDGRTAPVVGLLSALAIVGSLGFVVQSTLVLGLTRWHWQSGDRGTPAAVWDWLWYALVALGLLVSAWALLRSCGHLASSLGHSRPRRHALLAIPLLLVALLVAVRPSVFSDMVGPTVYRLLVEVMSAAEKGQEPNTPPADIPSQVPTPPPDQSDTAWRVPAHGHAPRARVGTMAHGLGHAIVAPARPWTACPFHEVSLA